MMSRNFSVYLDLVRFIAAMVVLLSHFAYARFSDGDYLFIRELNLGSDAVVIFFVLSGFVIAFAAEQKDKSLNLFFFNRLTRLLSVAVPALVVTFVCDRMGAYLVPEAYANWWYNPVSAFWFFLQGATFSTEWTGLAVRLGTNGPYWSLSYEFAYYVLFGIAFFLRGITRIVLFIACAAIFGLNILLLGPAWLLGVGIYHLMKREFSVSRAVLAFIAIVPLGLYVAMLALEVPSILIEETIAALGRDAYMSLRYSNELIWNNFIAALFAVHLFAMGLLLRGSSESRVFSKPIRWLAGASFSIYLVHYPVLQFLGSVLPELQTKLANHLILLSLTLIVCFLFAQLFERNLAGFRTYVRSVLDGRLAVPAR